MMQTISCSQKDIINLHVSFIESSSDSELLPSNAVRLTSELDDETIMVVGTHPGEQVPPAADKPSAGERAQGLIRGATLVLQHHGIPREAMDSFKTQAMAYLSVEDEAIFFKRAKYLTVAPMARYLRCESPKQPDLAWQPVGQYRNWANARLRVFNRKNTHLWYSFLQCKRSALPLSDDLVLTTYKEHRAAMEIKDPIDDCTHDSVMKELKPILKKIRKTLQRKYDTSGRDEDWLTRGETQHVASTKASFEKSRADGGQLGAMMRHVPTLYHCNPLNKTAIRRNPDLVRMTFYPRVVIGGVVQFNVVIEEYEYASGEEEWYESVRKGCVRYAEKQMTLKATIQAVLEPLKVRVISKGNAVPYYASKRLQRCLHDTIREMDCFRLVGAPLQAVDLYDLALNPVETGHGRLEWFSIDYSAATDKLSARLSASILGYLTEGQDEGMQNVWRAVLAPHLCEYPETSGTTVPPVQQVNGQLMGSILSFPILCLANLGLYLETIKEDERSLNRKLKGVLVNGDDMLYVAPVSLWPKHVENGAKVGLTMSPGKAYHHPVYANANSACYHFDLSRFTPNQGRFSSSPWSIPFLNSGLYFGQNKVLGGTDQENEKSYTSVISRLVQGALPGRQSEVLSMYLNRHNGAIKAECAGRNLFVTQALGGMGVEPVDGFHYEVSVVQRVLAQQLLDKLPYTSNESLPWKAEMSNDIPEAPEPLKAPWLCGLAWKESTTKAGKDGIVKPVPKFWELEEITTQTERNVLTKNIRRIKVELQKSTFRMTHMRPERMSQSVRVSSIKREGAEHHRKVPEPDQFTKNFRRDMISEYTESKGVQDWLPASPWSVIANSLDYVLSMENDLFC